MINLHGAENTEEFQAAELLAKLASDSDPEIGSASDVVLDIFASAQCYGQSTMDIDLLVFYADYREEERLNRARNGRPVHSFCLTVEVKGHPASDIRFEGARCSVFYNGTLHDVSLQSEKQKYAVRNYLKKNNVPRPPWVTGLIWLIRCPSKFLPKVHSNLLGAEASWTDFLDTISRLDGHRPEEPVTTFHDRRTRTSVVEVFSRTLQASKMDRKKLEAITRKVIDREKQQYAEKLGKQLLSFRGRGGTGKTIRLIQLGYQAYNEYGYRVLLLTYNKALVCDLRRILLLLGAGNSIGDRGIHVSTIHSFIYKWLSALGVVDPAEETFLQRYENLKNEALGLLRAGAIDRDDLKRSIGAKSTELAWDLILIDESQDWPENERDLIFNLYGPEKVVIADGVDQLVRGVDRIDWRLGLVGFESQVVPLRKSLRLKSSLCDVVSFIAESIGITDWNVEPVTDVYGGHVAVVCGDPFSEKVHRRLASTAKTDGNSPIDILLCVPPGWVTYRQGTKRSLIAERLEAWGMKAWDGVDDETRDDIPTDLEQFRIVQYESCRGLEGWAVVCYGLDEFFEHKLAQAEISPNARSDLFFNEEREAMNYAKRWLMIPLTRAIDTLVIHVSDKNSFVGQVLVEARMRFPDQIQWISS